MIAVFPAPRAPVMMNKLQYDVVGLTGRIAYEGPWNERPRDVANFARWMSHNLERDLNRPAAGKAESAKRPEVR